MSPFTIVISAIQLLAAVVIIVVVLLQSSRKAGLSGAVGGGAETFFGKNKGRSIEAKLARWTTVIAAVFILLTIALNVIVNLK